MAKGYDIPIIHVNADDAQACLGVVRLAMAYRAEFQDDVVIDLIGYRRHGHNEGDEPAYTQPTMYEMVRDHPTVRTLLADRLIAAGVISSAAAESLTEDFTERLRAVQALVKAENDDPQTPPVEEPEVVERETPLVSFQRLQELNAQAFSWPEDFRVHPKLVRQTRSAPGRVRAGRPNRLGSCRDVGLRDASGRGHPGSP